MNPQLNISQGWGQILDLLHTNHKLMIMEQMELDEILDSYTYIPLDEICYDVSHLESDQSDRRALMQSASKEEIFNRYLSDIKKLNADTPVRYLANSDIMKNLLLIEFININVSQCYYLLQTIYQHLPQLGSMEERECRLLTNRLCEIASNNTPTGNPDLDHGLEPQQRALKFLCEKIQKTISAKMFSQARESNGTVLAEIPNDVCKEMVSKYLS
jgi:hypothetical protein